MKFYLASACGFAELTKPGYEAFKARLREFVEIHCPWENPPPAGSSYADIGMVNAVAIRECDGLIAIVDGSDVDSGTAAEIGFAYALCKPSIGYRADLRNAADAGALVNAQVAYFLTRGICTDVTHLVSILSEMK